MTLTLNDYQTKAMITAPKDQTFKELLANCAMGMAGETGETADIIKKHLYHGHDLDLDKLEKEIGDVLWYLAVLSHTLGFELGDVAQRNLDKLFARYGTEFSHEKSINRPQGD